MRKIAVFLSLLLAVLDGTTASALDEALARSVMTRAVDLYIRPAHAAFHAEASALARATSGLCGDPTDARLKAVFVQFGATIRAWSRVEIIREGPVLQQNRFERVLFYPDRKSIGLKQVQALLARPDETVTDSSRLAERSVAIQGLGAFEYLFFGAYPEGLIAQRQSFRCRYGLAIARNVETIAAELDAAWADPNGIANDWKNPSPASAVYRTGAEAMQALIGLHVHGIEMVRDQRFKPFYRGETQRPMPNAALFRRSVNTMAAVEANLRGLADLWRVAGMDQLLPADRRALAGNVLFDYKAAAAAVSRLQPPGADSLADQHYRRTLDFLDFTLKDAIARINGDIGGAVGLEAGFSFADGD